MIEIFINAIGLAMVATLRGKNNRNIGLLGEKKIEKSKRETAHGLDFRVDEKPIFVASSPRITPWQNFQKARKKLAIHLRVHLYCVSNSFLSHDAFKQRKKSRLSPSLPHNQHISLSDEYRSYLRHKSRSIE